MKKNKTLPSPRNIKWRTIKMETEKNESSTNTYSNKKLI